MWNPFPGKEKKKKTSPIGERRIRELEIELERVGRELAEIRQRMRKALTRVGVIRYNPFRDSGGDQSFSIALLDEDFNGVVVTSHYGRDTNRVYAKAVEKGASSHTLSKEEQEAIHYASTGNQKQNTQ
ncbi:DUF4446 family protein [Patescibacteria group bacterium]|nr:DUF4446 family protein [Patescibacteria group bacterium]